MNESFEDAKRERKSADWQLDALLAELEQLGSALDSPNMSEQLLLGMHSAPKPPREDLPPPPPPSSTSAPSTSASSSALSARAISPDGDSAYGEGSSDGKGPCRHSALSSNDDCSIHTPSPTQVSPGAESVTDDSKEAKIRHALLKMREANYTRIFVKFFVDDGAPLQMLVDDRWTVAEAMRQLADKHHLSLAEDHCIVEEVPELYIRRIYEDDENLVENIQMWVEGSPNKLFLTRRPDKYSFLDRPELYLVTEKTEERMEVPNGEHWTRETKSSFVHEFFSREAFVPPELEGWMHLKGDGKKAWKKCYFVLRSSGLYYFPKGKKSTKDLQCLMNFHSNQVYTGMDWKKKYKAPTEFGFCLKLTQLQLKRSTYIKYICADDEMTFKKWVVALRVAKNGRQLYDNFVAATERRLVQMAAHVPKRVEVPRVGERTPSQASQRPSDCSASLSSSSSRALSLASSSHSIAHRGLPQYEDNPTGTIRRAPIDVIRRSTSSCPEEEDSDEETFPAPPPISSPTSTVTSSPLSHSPVPPPKPPLLMASPPRGPPPPPLRHTPIREEYATVQKKGPPPPPKRADGTRIMSNSVASPAAPHLSELEAALGRRRLKVDPI